MIPLFIIGFLLLAGVGTWALMRPAAVTHDAIQRGVLFASAGAAIRAAAAAVPDYYWPATHQWVLGDRGIQMTSRPANPDRPDEALGGLDITITPTKFWACTLSLRPKAVTAGLPTVRSFRNSLSSAGTAINDKWRAADVELVWPDGTVQRVTNYLQGAILDESLWSHFAYDLDAAMYSYAERRWQIGWGNANRYQPGRAVRVPDTNGFKTGADLWFKYIMAGGYAKWFDEIPHFNIRNVRILPGSLWLDALSAQIAPGMDWDIFIPVIWDGHTYSPADNRTLNSALVALYAPHSTIYAGQNKGYNQHALEYVIGTVVDFISSVIGMFAQAGLVVDAGWFSTVEKVVGILRDVRTIVGDTIFARMVDSIQRRIVTRIHNAWNNWRYDPRLLAAINESATRIESTVARGVTSYNIDETVMAGISAAMTTHIEIIYGAGQVVREV